MNEMGHLCREVFENANRTQRELAIALGISLGKCNNLLHSAIEQGYLANGPKGTLLTPKGSAYLAPYRVKNAVVIAAGIDVRFVPSSPELPKSLHEIEGERIIERIIRQLYEQGVQDITVVVGYQAERFEYLADKFGVKLLFNSSYASKGNLSSIYLASNILGNSYLITADYWFAQNPFHRYEPESWIACYKHEGHTLGVCVKTDSKRRATAMQLGGKDMLCKLGPVYADQIFVKQMRPIMEEVIARQPGMAAMRWEYFLAGRLDELELYANILPAGQVRDFESFAELRGYNAAVAEAGNQHNMQSIAAVWRARPEEVKSLTWLTSCAESQFYRFQFRGKGYVYRPPFEGTGRFTTVKQEFAVYTALEEKAITEELVYFDPDTGMKISDYYPLTHPFAAQLQGGDREALRPVATLLRKLHTSGAKVRHHCSLLDRLRQYDTQCRKAGAIRFEDYAATQKAIQPAIDLIQAADATKVLGHMCCAMHDYIKAPDGSLRMSCWEYAGMCHPLADVAMSALHFGCDASGFEALLGWYLNRQPTIEELRLSHSFAAVGGLLWSLWAEARQQHGEDSSGLAVRMYHQCKYFAKLLG